MDERYPLPQPAGIGHAHRVLTATALPGLLADPRRMKALAAIALGAAGDAEIALAAGLSVKEAAVARQRLAAQGLLTGPRAGAVDYDALTRLAREQAQEAPEHPDDRLSPFVEGGRLLSLPAQQGRRRRVLEHVVQVSFEAGRDYDETAVDDRLRPWCEGGGADHAALRRYLVEAGLLARGSGVYRVADGGPPPEPALGERLVRGLGLS